MESVNSTGMFSEIVKEEVDNTDEEKEAERIHEACKLENKSDVRSTKIYFECTHCDGCLNMWAFICIFRLGCGALFGNLVWPRFEC